MPNPEHLEFAALARELIAEDGRTVTFRRLDRTASDPSQPWLGSSDPRGQGSQTVAAPAVFVDPTSISELGFEALSPDLLKTIEQVCLVGPPTANEDLSLFDEIEDENDLTLRIVEGRKLRPGSVDILFILLVSR